MTERKRRRSNRRAFGSVRQLASGRWQARYLDERGRPMTGRLTYVTKAEAEAELAGVATDRRRGVYRDHRDTAPEFEAYARSWIESGGSRGKLAPSTAALYADLLRTSLVPEFGGLTLDQITAQRVRAWHAAMGREYAAKAATATLDGHKRVATGETRRRQAYALLRSILGQAVRDGDAGLQLNPATIVGAGQSKSPARPFLSLGDLTRVVEAVPEHIGAALTLALGAHLRVGELVALQRADLDLDSGILVIERQVVRVGGEDVVTGTKTGKVRRVVLPKPTLDAMTTYLAARPKALPRTPLFTTPVGVPLSRTMVQRAWRKATRELELTGYHVHDVRHLGLTLAAQGGATVAELMQPAGHSTTAAAMAYQHAAEDREQAVADALGEAMGRAETGRYGTRLARPALGVEA